MRVIDEIQHERNRQRDRWGDAHDDQHEDGSLAAAAICYIENEPIFVLRDSATSYTFQDPWPWDGGDPRCEGGSNVPAYGYRNYRKSLVQAAALLVAEVERLDRAETTKSPPPAPENSQIKKGT